MGVGGRRWHVYVRCRRKKFTFAISSPDEFLSTFCVAFSVFATGGDKDFKFDTLVGHSKSQPADDKPLLKGAWSW